MTHNVLSNAGVPQVLSDRLAVHKAYEPFADAMCQIGELLRDQIEDTGIGTQRLDLLIVVGYAWRKRRDVPVNVLIALLTSQTENVDVRM